MGELNLSKLFQQKSMNEKCNAYFKEVEIEDARYYKSKDCLEIQLKSKEALPFDIFQALQQYFSAILADCIIHVRCEKKLVDSNEVQKYFTYFSEKEEDLLVFKDKIPTIYDSELKVYFSNDSELERAKKVEGRILELFQAIGIYFDSIEVSLREIVNKVEDIVLPPSAIPEKPAESTIKKGSYNRVKKVDYPKIQLKDIENEVDQIQFDAKVMKVDYKETRTGNTIQTISVYDAEDAITIKRFETKKLPLEKMKEVKEGDMIRFFGSIVEDSYEQELIGKPSEILVLDAIFREDKATEKRVELHSHSTISEMDGVSDIQAYIQQAYRWGHTSFAITDHMAVQSFPKAQAAVQSILKKDPDAKFKMIYGVEMNLVNPVLTIVDNPNEELLNDCEYIAFDLETTGLSAHFDYAIEFGAVHIVNQTVVERKQFFIKPPERISAFTQKLTGIDNEMLEDAKPFSEVADELVEWLGNRVLVAHNARFDMGFLNEELNRLGKPALENAVIDTLDLARALHTDRRTYRLGNIARLYRIPYDEEVAHRADYDANVLADVFIAMLAESKEKGAKSLIDLQKLQDSQAFVKARSSHLCILAKNQKGLKAIYELVTKSNTKTLAVFRSRGSEFLAEPRIFREDVDQYRENLLIGSACSNGEVFEAALNKGQHELEKAMNFYDYIEVQPLENVLYLVQKGTVPNKERLILVFQRIIKTAKALGKIVVATGDVHYCDPEEKIYRDIYIQTQGVGGVRHPLYSYKEEVRLAMKTPEQHFRTTIEMMNSFSWLENDKLIKELVVDNSQMIANQIEQCLPVPKGLYPPMVEGADEKLRSICYETAHSTYGEILPEIVEQRLEKELNSIIGNGYGVIYYISHLLVKRSNDDGYLVGSRGSVGSSFAATMSGITEVNPLEPHYICPTCQYNEFVDAKVISSGFDLPSKECPKCQSTMRGEGQNIPFETFLGFEGDKVPDIDLNFSGEYQEKAHLFTKEVFGEEHVFRAGTIGTVQEKTAFGYVTGYCEEMNLPPMKRIQKERLALGCTGVKRTTGQHPGGIIVIPHDMEVTDFTPVQFPANDPSSTWKTTHFDFHDIHDNVLKFDILGHVDPTAMRLLQTISGIDPRTIPMNDEKVMSLFSTVDALNADTKHFSEKTGALGIPEFGTNFVRGILEITKPTCFSDLIIISGLSHGTDVWLNNAEPMVKQGLPLQEVIGCRDDIMTYLLNKNLDPKLAFTIMESVRKGKGLTEAWETAMMEHQVPSWYIDSCKKIKYMFPKAHAVAYVIMAIRIAWFKVHHPHWYYISYFSLRCDAYEIETMTKGIESIKARMEDIRVRRNNYETKHTVSKKEEAVYNCLEVCLELYARGYKIGNIDLYKSEATEFRVEKDNLKVIIPPFITVDGLGENVAKSIVEARKKGEFLSKQDLQGRTLCSHSLLKKLDLLGTLEGLQEENQMSLFE